MSTHACNNLCNQGLHDVQKMLDIDEPHLIREWCLEVLELLDRTENK
jgi:hypothetical protein